jgi:hypothetical protein
VTITTSDPQETFNYRSGVGAEWPFLADPDRIVQRDLDIADYTDPIHNQMVQEWTTPMADGEWSALQLVGHLFDVDVVYGFRWRLALTEDTPAYPGYDEKAWSRLARPAPPRLLDALAGLRLANAALLRSLDERDLHRRGVHGEQGSEDVQRMIDKVAGRDLAHLDQLRRTIAAVRPGTTSPIS